ncbi:hypothetical protein D3C72_2017050 [compost metagenome]
MPLLDEIAHRQAEIAEFCRHGNDQPHMRHGDLVAGVLIMIVAPSLCQGVLFFTLEIRCLHRNLDHAPVCCESPHRSLHGGRLDAANG